MYYKTDREQITAFIEQNLTWQGRGLYLRDVHAVYREWCRRDKQERWLGKMRLCAYLEMLGFERGTRQNIVRFSHGTFQPHVVPPGPETREERKLRAREYREMRAAERERRIDEARAKKEERTREMVLAARVSEIAPPRKLSLFTQRLAGLRPFPPRKDR